jgi:glycosyltransferase involved in cell wall biosynthesis
LDLVGTGDARGRYETQVRELGLQGRIRFAGYVPRCDIAAHYAAAHVFVLPSYNEGMSVATLEAMAAGLPVVVSRVGGTDELVEPGENGLIFDWAETDTLVDHLCRLDAERSLARRMGGMSRRRAECFSWDAAADRFVEMLKRVAAATSRQSGGQLERLCVESVE